MARKLLACFCRVRLPSIPVATSVIDTTYGPPARGYCNSTSESSLRPRDPRGQTMNRVYTETELRAFRPHDVSPLA